MRHKFCSLCFLSFVVTKQRLENIHLCDLSFGSYQEDVFQLVGVPLVRNALAGYNTSILSYGQVIIDSVSCLKFPWSKMSWIVVNIFDATKKRKHAFCTSVLSGSLACKENDIVEFH